jgi:hypothetical protein
MEGLKVFPLTNHQWIISSGQVLSIHIEIIAYQGLEIVSTKAR